MIAVFSRQGNVREVFAQCSASAFAPHGLESLTMETLGATMPTIDPQSRAAGASTRQAWRPLQRSTRVAILGALLATLFYQTFLLDPQYRGPTWLWTAVLLAEGLTAIHAIGTWWTILAHDNRDEPVDVTVWRNRLRSGAEVPSIDVFITAYGEAPELVGTTLRAARDMTLPHQVWVLDDGDSDALQAVCAREGVGYLRRDGGRHAKAGNVNAALARTTGEYVVILDADHVPEKNFLLQILPHFQDPDVASSSHRSRTPTRRTSSPPARRRLSASSTSWCARGRTTSTPPSVSVRTSCSGVRHWTRSAGSPPAATPRTSGRHWSCTDVGGSPSTCRRYWPAVWRRSTWRRT